jgi:hypothetical protein
LLKNVERTSQLERSGLTQTQRGVSSLETSIFVFY